MLSLQILSNSIRPVTVARLKSSSLLETVVALTILTLITGIVSIAMVKATQTSLTGQKVKAILLTDELVLEYKKDKNYLDENFENEDGLVVEKTVSPYQNSSNLLILTVKIYDGNQYCLNTFKEVISKNDN